MVFPLVMVLGRILGVMAVPIPAIETGIALSGVVLGLLVALAVRAPVWAAAGIVGSFAIFHGHAHGTELAAKPSSPYGYALGFVVGTGLLHAVGIGIGLLPPLGRRQGRRSAGRVPRSRWSARRSWPVSPDARRRQLDRQRGVAGQPRIHRNRRGRGAETGRSDESSIQVLSIADVLRPVAAVEAESALGAAIVHLAVGVPFLVGLQAARAAHRKLPAARVEAQQPRCIGRQHVERPRSRWAPRHGSPGCGNPTPEASVMIPVSSSPSGKAISPSIV